MAFDDIFSEGSMEFKENAPWVSGFLKRNSGILGRFIDHLEETKADYLFLGTIWCRSDTVDAYELTGTFGGEVAADHIGLKALLSLGELALEKESDERSIAKLSHEDDSRVAVLFMPHFPLNAHLSCPSLYVRTRLHPWVLIVAMPQGAKFLFIPNELAEKLIKRLGSMNLFDTDKQFGIASATKLVREEMGRIREAVNGAFLTSAKSPGSDDSPVGRILESIDNVAEGVSQRLSLHYLELYGDVLRDLANVTLLAAKNSLRADRERTRADELAQRVRPMKEAEKRRLQAEKRADKLQDLLDEERKRTVSLNSELRRLSNSSKEVAVIDEKRFEDALLALYI